MLQYFLCLFPLSFLVLPYFRLISSRVPLVLPCCKRELRTLSFCKILPPKNMFYNERTNAARHILGSWIILVHRTIDDVWALSTQPPKIEGNSFFEIQRTWCFCHKNPSTLSRFLWLSLIVSVHLRFWLVVNPINRLPSYLVPASLGHPQLLWKFAFRLAHLHHGFLEV